MVSLLHASCRIWGTSSLGQKLPNWAVRAMSAFLPIATTGRKCQEVWFVPILLQKSFWGRERKFLEPLMRFTRGDVRDHIVSSKSITGLGSGVEKRRSSREVQRSAFARFLGLFDFRLLQQNLPRADMAPSARSGIELPTGEVLGAFEPRA